uniref:Dynein heavy chain 3, axonemal n=1 Tax=Lygus hesperus TaxID=30085 RepID=A0A0A9XYW3_LYGHE
MPSQQPPSVFGLHENANITKDDRDARLLLNATLLTQPRQSSSFISSSTSSHSTSVQQSINTDPKCVVKSTATHVLQRLPSLYNIEAIAQKYPIVYTESMNTVLLQEAIRYNRLLARVLDTLTRVRDAIDGKVVMSA